MDVEKLDNSDMAFGMVSKLDQPTKFVTVVYKGLEPHEYISIAYHLMGLSFHLLRDEEVPMHLTAEDTKLFFDALTNCANALKERINNGK